MQPMTKMERVRAAVEGRALDRVPLCFWHHFKPGRISPNARPNDGRVFQCI